jgi:ParB family chromosome partitioning protein
MRALGALLTISREPAPELRRDAANALVALEDPRAKKRLVWMLSDPDAAVRDAALGCLSKLEKQPLDLAESALRSAQEDVRVRGLDVLVKQGKGKERAEALLGESLEDEAAKVRGEAFRTLWSWHEGDPFVPIDRALVARFPDVRSRAVSELEGMAGRKEKGALERLVKTIGDRDSGVAKAAYDAVVKLNGKDDPEAHLAAMASTHATMRSEGAKGAQKCKIKDDLRSALMKQLGDDDQGARTQALETLDKLLPTEGGPMYAGLQSSFLDLRVRAAELLAVRRDEQLIEAMRALLADKELKLRIPEAILVPLRRRAATALASLGSNRLLKYFATDLLKDEDPIVREQGARGLSNASRRGEEGHLLDALGHEEIAVRSWAAEGLARLGDVRALPVLTGTLRHDHPPIRVGAILSFAALGPEGYGGLLQGLEDPSRDVQHIVLTIVLARDLRAFRRGESPDLLTSALSSQRPEVRFAAARALELRIEPDGYLDHLVEVLLPPKPEKASDMANWPSEEQRATLLIGLAEALAGERPEQRYAAAQALRLRERPIDYFREVQRAIRPRSTTAPWVPETTPRSPEPPPEKPRPGPLAVLRKLFASGVTEDAPQAAEPKISTDEQKRLRMLAFGAYVGLLRQAGEDEESHRVRRDAIDRVVDLALQKHITVSSATPALARALDDPNHLVRKAAFAALKKVYEKEPETPLALALASDASDVARGALDELFARGESAKPRIASALNSKIPDARKYAFELLERLSPKGSLEPLLAALGSEHADVRIGVLERLSTSQDPRVLQALGKALESDHDDLRLRAAEMLAARKDDRCADVLAGLLRDPNADIATRSTEALVRLGTSRAVGAIASRIDDPAPDDVRLALCQALGRFRVSEAVTTLAARFADENEGVRTAAFDSCIAVVGPRSDAKRERGTPPPRKRDAKSAAQFLEVAAKAKAQDMRLRAAGELDDLDDPSADGLLLGLFGDRMAEIRAAAVGAYAKRVEKKNAPIAPLEDVLRAGARETMLAAAEGLASKQIGAAFRGLLLYVRAGEDGQRERALLALGTLGDPRALPELEVVVQGGTEEAPVEPPMQAAALEALGRLYDKLKDADEKERVRDRVEASVGHKEQGLAVAAVKALRWMGGERSRARIEGVMLARNSSSPERVAAAEALGEIKDLAAEQALAKALSEWDDDLRFAARESLEKLFPNERTRVELHAVSSDYDDISGPAATFLATEGDAGELLARIATLRDESLRERLRYGLVKRPKIPKSDLEKLLASDSADARADAAWLVGARSTTGHDHADLAKALAEASRKAEKRWAELKKSAHEDLPNEEWAWEVALWALRRVGKGDVAAADARKWVGRSDIPLDVRKQAAHALGEHGSDADAKLLVGVLSDAELRSFAASALAARGHDAGSIKGFVDPVILSVIASKGECSFETTAARKIHLVHAIRDGVTDGLLDMAREGEGQDRLDAIAALGRIATDEATEVLEELAFDKAGTKEDVRKAAYRSLRRAKRIIEKKEAASQ